jgi:hypothetical protein
MKGSPGMLECWSAGMIPRFDVDPGIDYDPDRLLVLSAEEIADGFAMVRDYEHLEAFSWSDVDEGLRAERSALDRAARDAPTERDFEDLLVAAEDEVFDDEGDGDQTWFGLDVGAAGLVLALCAALGVTFYSCRGHVPGSRHEAPYPQVGVVLDRERAAIVARLSAETSCGFQSDDEGKLWVLGRSVDDLNRLGSAIFSNRAEFDALPDPEWVAAVNALYDERSSSSW